VWRPSGRDGLDIPPPNRYIGRLSGRPFLRGKSETDERARGTQAAEKTDRGV